ncbi:MAG: GHKL domain-containing protein [Clostridia bacterium]
MLTANPLLYAISILVADTPWYAVACVPFLKQARFSKWIVFLIAAGSVLLKAISAAMLVHFLPDHWREWNFVHYTAHLVLVLLCFFAAFQLTPAKLTYTLLFLQAISTTVNFAASAVVAKLYPGVLISMATTPAYTVAIAIGNAATLPFVWHFFKKHLSVAFEELNAKSLWFMCLPPVLFLFLNQFFVTSIQKTGLPTDSIAILTLNILITGLITYYISLRILLDNARHLRSENEIQTRMALQAQNYENLTQSIQAARAARHDLRHHLSVIRDFCLRDDKAGLLAYLEEYSAALPADSTPDWCENHAVNALLRHYLSKAASAGVTLDVKLHLPTGAGVPDMELCIVFGNIFENAAASAAAQGKGAYLRARCETSDTDIVLTVENTIGANAPHGEGLGLKNVQIAAQKQGGSARFEQRGSIFLSRVLLMKAHAANQPFLP